MQEMQLRIGTLMVVVLLVVSLIVRFWEPEQAPDDENATVRIWSVDKDQVERLELVRPEGTLVLAKDGDDWRVEQPFQGRADDSVVADLVSDLAALEYGYPVDGADPAKVGLGEVPAARAIFTFKDKGTKELVLGNKTIDKRKLYARAPDGSVVAVQGTISALGMTAEEFRDRAVMRFAIPDVTSVVVVGPEGTLDLSKRNGRWWLEGFTRADDRRVEDLLLALLDLRFDSLSDPTLVPLRDGAFDVTVTFADGSTQGLHADMPVGKDEPVVISADSSAGPGLTGRVTGEVIAFLGQGPTDVGDPTAFPINVTAATSIDLDLGGARLTLTKVPPSGDAGAEGELFADEHWQIDGKDDPRVEPLMSALSDASVHYRAASVPPADPARKYGTIHATLGEGERTYDVFQEVEGSFRVATDAGGGGPYLVPVDQVDAIRRAMAP